MNSLPSPAASVEHSPRSSPSTPTRLGTKRARSASSEASSSKRAMSEDPSNAADPPSSVASPPSRSGDDDIDAYMRDQGEQDIILHVPSLNAAAGGVDALPIDPMKRYEYITALKNRKMVPGEDWYIVSRSWYRRWEKACTGEVDKEGAILETQLGAVNNSSFFKNDVFDRSSSLIESVDVEFVPLEAWNAFTQWYGTTPHEIRRKVITRGVLKEPTIELHPLNIPLYHVASPVTSNMSGQATVLELSCQTSIRQLLDSIAEKQKQVSGSESKIRIWVVADLDEGSNLFISSDVVMAKGRLLPVEREEQTLEDSFIEPTDSLALETQIDDKWIIDASPSADTSAAEGSKSGFLSSISSAAGYAKQKIFSSDHMKPSSSSLTKKHNYNTNLTPGNIGFTNLGNTCFMNSALQCLAHTKELVEYFMTDVYSDELNRDNPLGMGGAIAESFGQLLHRVWVPQSSSFAPREFKMQLSRFATQFSGYQQQDSQELVAFLLDGLHEDLNRVLKKPYVEKPDWEGGGDKELVALAKNSWEGYMKRNDSVIVDLFQGQYRSTLVCPECKKVSITFDPFMYLTLPLPVQKKWNHTILYIPWDNSKPHVKVPIEVNRNASFREVRNLLGRWMNSDPNNLLTMEIFSNRFYKYLDDSVPVGDMTEVDKIVCFELPCHAQQSRSWTPDPDPSKNPLILPIHLSKELTTPVGSYSRPISGFAHPFVIVLSNDEARDWEKIYAAIVDRLTRWTKLSRDLYRWEENDLANGAIPEEGDIVDEKSLMMEEDPAEAPPSSDRHLKFIGPKPELFDIRIQTGHKKLGEGNAFGSSKWEDSDSREKAMSDGDSIALLHEDDALYCNWDLNLRDYYFGDEPGYEQALWPESKWEEFLHPEYKESREAADSKKKKSITLRDCLEEFTREEELGEDDLWYCPQCKKHQQATKKFDLWNVPDVLVVHLKRFSNSRIMRDKIDAFVDFPVEGLDLESYCGEREVAKRLLAQGEDIEALGLHDLDEPLLYDLYAVDEHLGGLGGGHYRAYAQNHETGEWYHFDDQHVSTSSASESVNANAYLLFYKRRSNRPLGGKTFEKIEEARERMATAEAEAETVSQANLPTPPEEEEERPRVVSGLFAKFDTRKNVSTSSLAAQLGDDESDPDRSFGDLFTRDSIPSPSSSNDAEMGEEVDRLELDSGDEDGRSQSLIEMPALSSPHDSDL